MGLAQHSTDVLFVVKGLVLIVVFHARVVAEQGQVNEFKLSERSPAMVPVAEFSPGSATNAAWA